MELDPNSLKMLHVDSMKPDSQDSCQDSDSQDCRQDTLAHFFNSLLFYHSTLSSSTSKSLFLNQLPIPVINGVANFI